MERYESSTRRDPARRDEGNWLRAVTNEDPAQAKLGRGLLTLKSSAPF